MAINITMVITTTLEKVIIFHLMDRLSTEDKTWVDMWPCVAEETLQEKEQATCTP